MKREFAYIRDYERDLINKDKKRNELFNSIWNMVNLKWDFAPEHKAKMKNVRTLVDASPSDAVHNASIALSNTIPRWMVAPYGSSLFELMRAEKLEHCIGSQFKKMNERGDGTLLYEKMRMSIMYDTIVTRIDDLEFQFKGVKTLSPFQRRVRNQGRFLGQVFDPRTIHTENSMGTFVAILHVENTRAQEVYKYWETYENNSTDGGKRVAEARRKMEQRFLGKNKQQIDDLRFVMLEFISDDQILKHGYFVGDGPHENILTGDSFTSSDNDIIFADEENTLGFINWSIRRGGSRTESDPAYQVNPMLAPLHWGNTWETLNVVRSLVMSEPIKRMFEAHQFQTTADGQRLAESDDGVIVGRRGDEAHNLPQAQLDPNTMAVVQALQQELTRTTGANVLSDVTSAKTTPFATLNAMIQVAMSRLDINRRDGALSCADDALLMLRWVEKTKVPLLSYRYQNKTMQAQGFAMQMAQGDQVVVQAGDFDADQMELDVEIKPKTPTDFQQQILSAIQLHDKLQVPYEYLLEYLGFDNIPLLRAQYQAEMTNDSEFQTGLQVASQQAMMAATQPQQPPAGPNGEPATSMPQPGGISQSAMGALGGLGQGVNPAMMGESPQNFMPGMTREMVSGQTQGGEPIQAGGD